MKHIKVFLLFNMIVAMSCTSFAQNQSFDVISYTLPKGWQQQKSEGGMQLSVTDKKTGGYVLVVITKSNASTASARDNFDADWNKLVKGTVSVTEAPSISDMDIETGWNCISGQANYTDGNNKGLVTMITATGKGQTCSVVIMGNTSKYKDEVLAFVNSLELAPLQNENANTPSANSNKSGNTAVVGLWCNNHLETSGYSNGFPQYTAGYFRQEYLFKEDGTYIFRLKNWSTLLKDILFAYESGTYTVRGNQLTIIPNQGRGEWWSKNNNNTKLWGNRLKASDYKLEKTNYTFEIKYYSGSKDYALLLNPNKTTERDGTYTGPTSFSYTKRENGISIIDNPPGFKIGFENKSSSTTSSKNNNH